MQNNSRRNFIKITTCSIGAVSIDAMGSKVFPFSKFGLSNQATTQDAGRSFDPLLDKNCKIINPIPAKKSDGLWMWYPGQKTAHIHARIVQDAMERCSNMGYPGSFCQPEYYAYFKKNITVTAETEIKWYGSLGRIRMDVDGFEVDITSRKRTIPAGTHLVEIMVDFSKRLPCILIEGDGLLSPSGWLVSLDKQTWITPEFESLLNNTEKLPDDKKEVVVEIPVDKIVVADKVTATKTGFIFSGAGSLTVDLWHNELGQIVFAAKGEGQLYIHAGESQLEAQDMEPAHMEQKAIPAVALTKTGQLITVPERCVRFIHIKSTGSCIIENLHFKASVTPVLYKGSFVCNDGELNTIWQAGAATIHSCMHDIYMDGIKRDAMSWADAIMGAMAGDCIFFDTAVARNSIVSQLLPVKTKATDLGIVDFPMYTYLGFEHDYMMRGELSFISSYQQNLFDTLDFYASQQDENGFVNGKNFKTWGFFPDWSLTLETGPDRYSIPCYAQMLIMKSFEIGGAFALLLNNTNRAEKYTLIAKKLRENIRAFFWDTQDGAFFNGIDSTGKIDKRKTSFAQVWGILFDLVQPDEYDLVFEKVLNNAERDKQSVSLNQVFEAQAYAKAGKTGMFIKRIKKVWGQMIKMGYSRFAEDIRPWQDPVKRLELYGRPFANSLCHVWAGAAPVLALSIGVLGVKPLKPAFTECIIQPQLAGLEWIKGAIPTPSGIISIELSKEKGGKIILPENVKATLVGVITKNGKTTLVGPGVFEIKLNS